MQTLQLNSGYEPIGLVSWKKAIKKVLSGKAEVLDVQDSLLRYSNITDKKPAVIRIFKYHKAHCYVRLNRENIFARDQYVCQYCGKKFKAKELTLDHIIPQSRGGPNSWTNLVTCCDSCNNKKDNRTPEEANMPLRTLPTRPNWLPAILVKAIKNTGIPPQWARWLDWVTGV